MILILQNFLANLYRVLFPLPLSLRPAPPSILLNNTAISLVVGLRPQP